MFNLKFPICHETNRLNYAGVARNEQWILFILQLILLLLCCCSGGNHTTKLQITAKIKDPNVVFCKIISNKNVNLLNKKRDHFFGQKLLSELFVEQIQIIEKLFVHSEFHLRDFPLGWCKLMRPISTQSKKKKKNTQVWKIDIYSYMGEIFNETTRNAPI